MYSYILSTLSSLIYKNEISEIEINENEISEMEINENECIEYEFLLSLLPKDILNICLSYFYEYEIFYIKRKWSEITMPFNAAIYNGWLDLMKYIIKNNYKITFYECSRISQNGNLNMIKFFKQKYPEFMDMKSVHFYAAAFGDRKSVV